LPDDEQTAARISTRQPSHATACVADIASAQGRSAVVKALDEEPTVLVNNAGITSDATLARPSCQF
jgi:short-subunit dehydrogenase